MLLIQSRKDLLLAEASNSLVTEKEISTNGATEGESVGNNVWRVGELNGEAVDNINTMLRDNGVNPPNIPDYAHLFMLYFLFYQRTRIQNCFSEATMKQERGLNGTRIHQNEGYYFRHPNYQTFLPITLKQGKNVLLITVD